MKQRLFYCLAIIGIMMFFCAVWQSSRYLALQNVAQDLEREQQEIVQTNERLLAEIAELSRSERIVEKASALGLIEKGPEDVTQILIRQP
ncbi:hypothetical protein FACS1894164_07690 [Spirochaetia bacterium]|nr:hypothetical protein FACS1894164_07690 [Spirochaetia bacterium]